LQQCKKKMRQTKFTSNHTRRNSLSKTIMSIPETSLSAPLSNYLYHGFIRHYGDRNNKAARKSPLEQTLASRLHEVPGSPGYHAVLVGHEPRMTPTLIKVGDDPEVYQEVQEILKKTNNDISEIKAALISGLKSLIPSARVGTADKVLSHDISLDDTCYSYYVKAMYWSTLVEESCRPSARAGWSQCMNCWVNRNLCLVPLEGKYVVMSHDALLMVKDLTMSHFLIDIYSRIDPTKSSLREDLSFWIQWCGICLDLMNNDAYEVIKGIEPIVTCRLIELSEDFLDAKTQSRQMVAKFTQKEQNVRAMLEMDRGPSQADRLYAYLHGINSPERLAEFFSMMKVMGHPYVDAVAGSEAIRELGQAKSTHSIVGVKAVEWSFCHIYTRGYLKKKGEWPALEFSARPEGKTTLEILRDEGHPDLPLGLTLYDPSDWDFARFIPHEEFDYGEDILDLSSDTALSYKRSEVDSSWAGRLDYQPPKPTSSNRVLEELLTMKRLDMRDVCDKVSQRDIPFDWKIVTVSPKEREMKKFPRMFAMMVIFMRYFFALTEKNIAKKIFPCIPEQTMTLSESERTKLFLSLTQPSNSKIVISFGIDFSKWCSHFRDATVSPIGRRLGQITGGHGLFDVVHWFFGSCIMVLRHPSFTPRNSPKGRKGDLVTEPGVYKDCSAGLEGICQKLWTLVTLCLLHWAIWKFGLKYNITCQGDNLVLYVEYIPTVGDSKEDTVQKVRSLADRILEAISDAAGLIGHEVKAEECTQSTGFTTYGKDMWFRGRLLETTVKSLSRMIPMTSTDVPSFFQVLSNIAATGSAAVARCTSSLPIFIFTKFMENWVIRKEFRSSLIHPRGYLKGLSETLLSESRLKFSLLLTLVPSNLGGLPVSSLAEFMYRGHSDPLSSSLSSLWIFRSLPIVRSYFSLLSSGWLTGSKPNETKRARDDWEGLINDPFSIPLTRPPTPIQSMASKVRESLVEVTKNVQLRPIVLATKDVKNRSVFFRSLSSTTPFYPKVLHEIYKASNFGVVDDFSSRFTNTRTLFKLSKTSGVDVTGGTLWADKEFTRRTIELMADVYKIGLREIKSPYSLCKFLRKEWKVGDLEGVTTLHPLSAGRILMIPADNEEIIRLMAASDSSLVSAVSLIDPPKKCMEERGNVMPYLGEVTSDKSVAKWIKPLDSSPPLKDVIRLLQIAQMMTVEGSPARAFIEKVVQSRTNFPLELLYKFTKVKVAGAIAHRFNLRDSSQGSFLSSISTWASHFSVSSDLSGKMGEINYPVSFHEYVLSLLTISNWVFNSEPATLCPFGLIFDVDLSDTSPVVDHYIDLQEETDKTLVTTPRASLYYLTAETIKLSTRANISKIDRKDLQLAERDATVPEAVSQIFLSCLTQLGSFVRKSKYVRAEVSKSRVIDLPECSLITEDQYVKGAGLALLMGSCGLIVRRLYKDCDVWKVISEVLFDKALIMVPRVYGTLLNCAGASTEWTKSPPKTLGLEKSLLWWVLTICKQSLLYLRSSSLSVVPVLFSLGQASTSSGLTSRVMIILLMKILWTGERAVVTTKLIGKLLVKINEAPSEIDRVSDLLKLSRVLGVSGCLRDSGDSPQQVLRRLRDNPVGKEDFRRPLIVYHLNQKVRRLIGTEEELILSDIPHESASVLLQSWCLRPYPRVSDAYHRWAPISDHLETNSRVLVIGIGAGGILECIPDTCSVTGLDLACVLVSLGQAHTHYVPPVYHPNYSTHPASWLTTGDIFQEEVLALILRECTDGLFSHVLIDIEGVSTYRRSILRHRIASTGAKTWVRLHDTPKNMSRITSSFCSYQRSGDYAWCPEVSLGWEVVLGSSSSPLGLYNSQEDVNILPVLPPQTFQLEQGEIRTISEFSVILLGGTINDLGNVSEFLARKIVRTEVGKLSLLQLYFLLVEGGSAEVVLSCLGRGGTRALIALAQGL
jgi:hypothetical protein